MVGKAGKGGKGIGIGKGGKAGKMHAHKRGSRSSL
jgi:hypothetical protein